MAALARAQIDAYYVFFYIAVEDVDLKLKEFRWLIWDFHSESRRLKKLQLIGSVLPAVNETEILVGELKTKLMEHDVYQSLEPHVQKRLRNAKEGIFSSNTELSSKAGIDEAYYKNVFMFLSSYVHSHPFSIEQLTAFRAGEEESLRLLKVVIEYTSIYLCLSLRDFVKLVPSANNYINQDTQDIIDIWVGVVNDFSEYRKA
jgi:hypothetical protein